VSERTVGGRVLVVRGPESAAVGFAMRDVFPPKGVTGLVAVPGTGSIDLSWEAGSEADLAGYRVYRREGEGREVRLNGELVVGPAYRDTTAVAGVTYGYRVTAVDASGNESAAGEVVREGLR
jgi:fibronectin type 3 domain-containing protein